MTLTGDEALVGRVLSDRYLIGDRIARGGMASVFRATDQRLDREVAIKVMHHGLGDDRQFTERFVREARSAAQLNHRNVVSVFDQGTDGEITYLVMEYVPGRTLRDIMRDEAPMPPYRALELLEQVLIALSAAHAAKIIHRDVKPENVLITPDGDVKVADFGLARAVSAATTATGGTLIGTVSYLAPEIVTNDGADARSDVYACGAMLYEMLTGIKPHSGESPIQVAYKHVHEDIGPPSKIQRGIPPYVDALVARATVRDRDQRSTDARVMLQQLRSVQRALDAGLDDDPDLVADLHPLGRVAGHDETDETSDEHPTVSVPRAALAGAAAAGSSTPTEAVTTSAAEHTMQWGDASGPPPPPTAATAAAGAAKPAGLHPPMSREEYGQSATKPHSRRGRILLIVAVAVALVAGLLTWYFADLRYTSTPVLTGSAVTVAQKDAEDEGFDLKIAKQSSSEDVAAGIVISTDPAPGDKILPGSTIEAVVSKGAERYFLPKNNLKNMTLAGATKTLEALHLEVGDQKRQYSETIKTGRVIGPQGDVTSATPFKRGETVDLLISKGRKPIDVKDYTGRTEGEATAALKDAGFKVDAEREFSEDVEQGVVISQDPDDGTQFKNDTITLVVSKGPELIEVPNVKGMKKADARRAIEAAGLKFFAPYIPGAGNFEVRRQNPDPGERVRRDTRIFVFPL